MTLIETGLSSTALKMTNLFDNYEETLKILKTSRALETNSKILKLLSYEIGYLTCLLDHKIVDADYLDSLDYLATSIKVN